MAAGRDGRLVSFVTETEVEALKKKRQEEWEKVRKPGDPKEAPQEANYDPRPLYERLKEQKDKHQEEWDEKFKFKNMIYQGLDDEEAGFLNLVTYQQSNRHAELQKQEKDEINAYKTAVSQLIAEESEKRLASLPAPSSTTVPNTTTIPTTTNTLASSTTTSNTTGTTTTTSSSTGNKRPSTSKKSQLSLIAGAIRRKRTSSESSTGHTSSLDDPPESKVIKTTAVDSTHQISPVKTKSDKTLNEQKKEIPTTTKRLTSTSLISYYSSSSGSEGED